MIITCTVPPGTTKSELTPFPGDDAALAEGCLCPVDQEKWPRAVMIEATCPIHELQKAPN